MAAIELARYLRDTTRQYHACLEACVECLVACEMCSDACLDEPNVEMMARCVRLDRDCAEACAEECARHAAEHDHCRAGAAVCRRCEAECRKMAGAARG